MSPPKTGQVTEFFLEKEGKRRNKEEENLTFKYNAEKKWTFICRGRATLLVDQMVDTG
jgi:hypothetical protein